MSDKRSSINPAALWRVPVALVVFGLYLWSLVEYGPFPTLVVLALLWCAKSIGLFRLFRR